MRTPQRTEKLYCVVRQDDKSGHTYAPNRFEQRSKKFFSRREALERMRVLGGNGRMFEADVSEWREVDVTKDMAPEC